MAHTVIPPPRGTTATLELTHEGNIEEVTGIFFRWIFVVFFLLLKCRLSGKVNNLPPESGLARESYGVQTGKGWPHHKIQAQVSSAQWDKHMWIFLRQKPSNKLLRRVYSLFVVNRRFHDKIHIKITGISTGHKIHVTTWTLKSTYAQFILIQIQFSTNPHHTKYNLTPNP